MAAVNLGRAEPTEKDWPGREVSEEDVRAASGDYRDWFSYKDRMHYHNLAWAYFRRARKRVKDLHRRVNWGQLLVAGRMGASKSVWTGSYSLGRTDRGFGFLRGTPFFHFGGNWLFGRALEGSEVYDAIQYIPSNSIFAMDEAHVAADGSVPNNRGNALLRQLSAGLRKKQCLFILITAKPNLLDRRIRADCDRVVLPVKPQIDVQGQNLYQGKVTAKNDMNNFALCFHLWEDFPYQRQGDPEDRSGRYKGVAPLFIGQPDKTMAISGERVRASFALTDSFIPVESGTAWNFGSAEGIATAKKEREQNKTVQDAVNKVVGWILSVDPEDLPAAVSTNAIAGQAGVPNKVAADTLERFFGVYAEAKTTKGWRVDELQAIAIQIFQVG